MKIIWVRWLVLWAYGSIALGSPASPVVGLVRIEAPEREDFRKASVILEARFHRWLENQGVGISLKRVGGVLDPSLVARERLRGDLRRELIGGSSLVSNGKTNPTERITRLRQMAESDPSLGFEVAPALGRESVDAWVRGQWTQSESLWRRAIELSPDGDVPGAGWKGDAPQAWREMADRVLSSWHRDCLLKAPVLGLIESLNGFSVPPVSEFAVASGKPFQVRWRDSADVIYKAKVICPGPGQRDLSAETSVPFDLTEIAGQQRADSLVFLETKGEGFGFYLFTPGVGLGEISLDGELSVADVLSRPLAGELPVDREAFRRLRASHHLGGGALLAGPWMGQGVADAVVQATVPRWYNSWTTWAVAGGILTGVLVACLTSRSDPVRTQAHGGLTFRVE